MTLAEGARSVLITGASGRVGSLLAKAWREQYALTLLDRIPPRQRKESALVGDVSSLHVMRSACSGIDTVVHLAGVPSPQAAWSELRRPNVRGTWAVLKAAREQGCRRLVFASSVMIEVDPRLAYSQAKALGERLCERYARRTTLSTICLRLGHVLSARDRALWPDARHLPWGLIEDDLVAAFTLAVDAPPSLHCDRFTIISANRHPHCDFADARARLGYEPRYDAFALAERQLRTPRGLLKRAKRWVERRL